MSDFLWLSFFIFSLNPAGVSESELLIADYRFILKPLQMRGRRISMDLFQKIGEGAGSLVGGALSGVVNIAAVKESLV